jgi:hypothetical protein
LLRPTKPNQLSGPKHGHLHPERGLYYRGPSPGVAAGNSNQGLGEPDWANFLPIFNLGQSYLTFGEFIHIKGT